MLKRDGDRCSLMILRGIPFGFLLLFLLVAKCLYSHPKTDEIFPQVGNGCDILLDIHTLVLNVQNARYVMGALRLETGADFRRDVGPHTRGTVPWPNKVLNATTLLQGELLL